jgi:heavy metal sensor kinase
VIRRPHSVRIRLALAYAATFGFLLVAHDIGAYAWVRHEVFEALDHEWDKGAAPGQVDRGPAYQKKAASVEHELHELAVVLLLIIVPGALAAGVCGWLLARRAFAPVDGLSAHAARITADRLSERIPVANPEDELGRLAAIFNAMIGRLDASFGALRRFTANASHELRTPLTALRTIGEVGIREERDAAGLRDVVGSMLEEIDGMTQLVDSLLTLARADDGTSRLELVECDLSELARQVIEQLAPLAEEKRQQFVAELAAPVKVKADAVLMRRAIANLVDNAIKYSPQGATIRVASRQGSSDRAVEVSDHGPGIALADQERIFERFHRVDPSRARDPAFRDPRGGSGLGLALARATVVAHGGRIEVQSAEGAGATFRIVLPR